MQKDDNQSHDMYDSWDNTAKSGGDNSQQLNEEEAQTIKGDNIESNVPDPSIAALPEEEQKQELASHEVSFNKPKSLSKSESIKTISDQ